MAFTVDDFVDLLRLLEAHPEWRAQLRSLLLSEELLTVPERLARIEQVLVEETAQLRELRALVREQTAELHALRAVAEQHTQELRELRAVVEEHTRQLQELRAVAEQHTQELRELRAIVQEHTQELRELRAIAQEHTRQLQEHTQELRELRAIAQEHTRQLQEHTQELRELRAIVQEHTQQLQEHTRQLVQLTRQVEALERTVQLLANRLDRVAERGDRTLGMVLELRAQQRLSSWLGRYVRGLRARPPGEWEREFRALLAPEAFDRLLDADLVARGRLAADGQREVWLVVEVSHVIAAEDVARAVEWTRLLRRVGLLAIPVVLGAALSGEAQEAAEREQVVVVEADLDRVRTAGWEQARTRWAA